MASRYRRAAAALAFAVAVCACGGSSDGRSASAAAGNGPDVCPPLVGAYVVTGDLVETTCPGMEAHTERLVLMNGGPEAGCRTIDQRAAPKEGGCSYEETQTCPRKGMSVTATLSLAVPPDARDIRGTSIVQFESEGRRCMGRYRVRYAKTAAR